jgi:hypothetical protein
MKPEASSSGFDLCFALQIFNRFFETIMKINYSNQLFILCLTCLVVIAGCSRNKPADFPKMYSYTFTVLFQGKPVEKARVMFFPEQSGQNWVVGGETDIHGIAQIYTHQGNYMKLGIPAGTFKVTLSKTPEIAQRSKEEKDKMTQEDFNKYIAQLKESMKTIQSVVPMELSNRTKTPLEIVVGGTENSYTVNLEQYK